MLNTITIDGYWDVKLYGETGELKDHRYGKNVITTVGKEALAEYLATAATASVLNPFRNIAIGTSTTPESSSDTALGVELSRKTGNCTYTSGGIFEVTATFAAGSGTGAIAEYGLLNTATGGTLFSRDTEDVVNKGASDILIVTHRVTFS